MAVGIGYDSHRLQSGRAMLLGGVEIAYDLGLAGHSDADVLTHAIIDALLGAAALGDIGQHFPDNEQRYRGISSLKLLEQVGRLLAGAGWRIVNVDATVIIERPKLAPHIPVMRQRLARSLGVASDQISVKAKTNEGMGFVGREEGVAAIAVAEVKRNART
ncbi:MAG: 2-C-methyl-D-erythritol 2,4-cyclodiphosphate synthase [Bacillota bacterium]|jgi:2-C-methyl-D-erythritol 2,4-cyclodiphosphate synthase